MDPRDTACLSQELIYLTSVDPGSGKREAAAVVRGTDSPSRWYAQRITLKPCASLHTGILRGNLLLNLLRICLFFCRETRYQDESGSSLGSGERNFWGLFFFPDTELRTQIGIKVSPQHLSVCVRCCRNILIFMTYQ